MDAQILYSQVMGSLRNVDQGGTQDQCFNPTDGLAHKTTPE